MRSYCTYKGNCVDLGLGSLFVNLLDGTRLEVSKSQYVRQLTEPAFECEILVHALPTEYMSDNLGVDMIIGRPLLFNYYTIFNFETSKIGLYKAAYSKSNKELTTGAVMCILLFVLIPTSGLVACFLKYNQPEIESKCLLLNN